MVSLEHSRRVVEQSLLRLKWLAAAANFELAMRRHARALKANFNPNQPRVPRGNPDGGQWTDAGGGGGGASPGASRTRVAGPGTGRTTRAGQNFPGATHGQQVRLEQTIARTESALAKIRRWKESHTVAVTEISGSLVFGTNSGAPGYTGADKADADVWRGTLITKYPDIMSTGNIGAAPNNSMYHAEATILLKAARDNGGTLAGKHVEVHVNRSLCTSCDQVLPLLGRGLGNPTVTYVDTVTGARASMADGKWLP